MREDDVRPPAYKVTPEGRVVVDLPTLGRSGVVRELAAVAREIAKIRAELYRLSGERAVAYGLVCPRAARAGRGEGE